MTTKMADEQSDIPADAPEQSTEAAPTEEAVAAGEDTAAGEEAPATEGQEQTPEEQPAGENAAPGEGQDGAAEDAAPATEGETAPQEVDQEASPEADEAEAAAVPEGEDQAAEGEGQIAEGQTEEGAGDAGAEPATDEPAAEGDMTASTGGDVPPAEGEAGTPGEGDAPGAGETEGDPGQEGEAGAEGEAAAPTEGEEGGEGGEAAPVAEGDAPAEGEAGEAVQAAEGEEGEAAPQEGETAPQEGEEQAEGEGDAAERTGSPALQVGVPLSREGTPEPGEGGDLGTARSGSPLVPGTPDDEGSLHDGSLVEEEEEEEEEIPQFDREQLVEKYHQALSEREQLQQQNYQLQHKLAEYFRKKKSDDARQDVDKNVTDQEQRYLKYMANLEELRHQDGEEREHFKIVIEDLKDRCGEKETYVKAERDKFMEFKKQVALNAINSRSGKPIAPKDIEQYLATDNRKEKEVVDVRLENIKLKNKLRKKELQLKSKEELAEGLHLIDFEQLKIENQTYNEKIEERNEELLKLRKKITSTVQVLTHLKEKLQFVQAENHVLKGQLRNVEDDAAKKRDRLTRTKQARDHLRIDNHRLRQNCGLLGNEPLLRDFEERKDESEELRSELDRLKMMHAELTLSCNGVRKKIEQARHGQE